MANTILFLGKISQKQVHAWGISRPMFVKPAVVSTELEMGVLVYIYETIDAEKPVAARFWGLVVPHDLITCWRAMLILEKVQYLDNADLCDSYYAAMRHPHESDSHRVSAMIGKIGLDSFKSIMNQSIPEEVVKLFVQLLDAGDQLALWPLTEEIQAGTLPWSDELARIGVKHSDQVEKRNQAERVVIATYETHFSAYAKAHDFPRRCLIMAAMEGSLIEAVEKGLAADYGPDIAFGIAALRAHLVTNQMVAILGFEPQVDRHMEDVLKDTSLWLSGHFKTGRWLIKKPLRNPVEYTNLLGKLYQTWEKLPLTHVLPAV